MAMLNALGHNSYQDWTAPTFPSQNPDNTGHCPQVQDTGMLEQSLDMSKSSFLKACFFLIVFILNYISWDDIAWHVSYNYTDTE